MKRSLLGLMLCLCCLVSACGVQTAAAPAASAETAAPETTAPEIEAPETTDPGVTGTLFLTVSEMDLTLVGDSENIYIGTVSPEEITWTSDDESVIRVEDGVVTAVGVGSATVTAAAGDQTVSCRVGCLAPDQEALMALGEKVYRSPKRLPPQVPEDFHFRENSALLGDSITFVLFKNESLYGGLDHPLFLARGGTSLTGLLLNSKKIIYKGHETPVADALQASGVDSVFVLLGQNDLDFMEEQEAFETLQKLMNVIREKNPELEIILQSCIPKFCEDLRYNHRNEKVLRYNALAEDYAAREGMGYMHLSRYVEDHMNSMAQPYSMDDLHLNVDGCNVWMQALKAYCYMTEIQ